jgi:muramoyltetrapeptide carboxypeptidase
MVPKPRRLVAGATIRLVTPASPLTLEKVEFATSLLKGHDFDIQFSKHCFDQDDYLAGSDRDRASDLMEVFLDPGVDAILCSRGGYGCARLFPYLDLDQIARSRKLFLGFSDVTTLHVALNNRGFPTVHAPMALTLSTPREQWVYDSFIATLKGTNPIPSEAPRGIMLVEGVGEGQVVGGCLCLLCDTIGTPNALNAEGRILIIEDVDENPHRIDAMLTHLINAGVLQKAAGIVIGEMTRSDERCDEGIGGKPWRDIVQDRLGGLGIPTIINFPFGHNKNMLSLPLGVRARLDANLGTLEYLESWCE